MLVRKIDINTGHVEDVEIPDVDYPVHLVAPDVISDRQFYQQLAVEGRIGAEEALAAVMVGTLPVALETIVSTLPTTDQFGVRMLLSGATDFSRFHPLVGSVASSLGMSAEDVDAFWLAASHL